MCGCVVCFKEEYPILSGMQKVNNGCLWRHLVVLWKIEFWLKCSHGQPLWNYLWTSQNWIFFWQGVSFERRFSSETSECLRYCSMICMKSFAWFCALFTNETNISSRKVCLYKHSTCHHAILITRRSTFCPLLLYFKRLCNCGNVEAKPKPEGLEDLVFNLEWNVLW